MHTANKQEQDIRIYENLKRIGNVIAVLSGKGGVGKSTVAVNLAYALVMAGHTVGIMDVDIHGPNVPKMLGIDKAKFGGLESAVEPVEVLPNFRAASIGLVGYAPEEAFIWRGPMKIALVRQFLGDVSWGELDYLIIDTPPGTGDEALTVAQLIPSMKGAVIVSTPQEVSILDSSKSMTFARKLNLPILGIVENMSAYMCPHCNTPVNIFGAGGGEEAAERFGIAFLGSVPIDPRIVHSADSGEPFLKTSPTESPTNKAFQAIIARISEEIEKNTEAGLYTERVLVDPRIEQAKQAEEREAGKGDAFRPLQ